MNNAAVTSTSSQNAHKSLAIGNPKMDSSDAKTNLLHRRYPLAYDNNDLTPWVRLDTYFTAVTGSLSGRQRRIFLTLCAETFTADLLAGKKIVYKLSELSALTGIRTDHLAREIASPAFMKFFEVAGIEEKMPHRLIYFALRSRDEGEEVKMVHRFLVARSSGQWCPMTSDMLRFLNEKMLSKVQVDIVLQLLQLTDFDGGTVARIGDENLWQRLGVTQGRNVWREITRPGAFAGLVTIRRGSADSKGHKGIVTSYGLSPLLLAFRAWRRGQQPIEVVDQRQIANDNAERTEEMDPEMDPEMTYWLTLLLTSQPQTAAAA